MKPVRRAAHVRREGRRDEEKAVPTIQFLYDGTSKTVTLPASAGEQPTLLAIARDHNVPLLFNCEAGACGACIVEIETASGDAAAVTDAEVFFLRAIGKLDSEGANGSRLACQYRPGHDEDVSVRFASALCSF